WRRRVRARLPDRRGASRLAREVPRLHQPGRALRAEMKPTDKERPESVADKDIREASLEYHRQFPPGKISLLPTKQLTNQRDLALAYTPGVAAACDEIVRHPAEARNRT